MQIKNSTLVPDNNIVNTKEIIHESFELVNDLAKSKGLYLSVINKGEVPELLHTDKYRIKIILTELLECAIKFVNRGNLTLIVKAKKNKETPMIKWKIKGTELDLLDVSVTSILNFSVSPEINLVNRRSRCMNLFVSKKLIEILKGTFKVKVKSKGCSYISFNLPIKVCGEMRELLSPKVPEELKCECPRVLVVDSNHINRYVINSYIDRLKIRCNFSQDEESALSFLEERKEQRCCQHYPLLLLNVGIEERQRVFS